MPRLHLKLLFDCGETIEGELITGPERRYGPSGIYKRSQLLNLYIKHTGIHNAEKAKILDGNSNDIGTVIRTIGGASFQFTATT